MQRVRTLIDAEINGQVFSLAGEVAGGEALGRYSSCLPPLPPDFPQGWVRFLHCCQALSVPEWAQPQSQWLGNFSVKRQFSAPGRLAGSTLTWSLERGTPCYCVAIQLFTTGLMQVTDRCESLQEIVGAKFEEGQGEAMIHAEQKTAWPLLWTVENQLLPTPLRLPRAARYQYQLHPDPSPLYCPVQVRVMQTD